jgi:hypothetical protein
MPTTENLDWLARHAEDRSDTDNSAESLQIMEEERFGAKMKETNLTRDPFCAYRGFSTSFAHSFVNLKEEHNDICAFLCCGIMQKDRNAYLMTGKKPPSCIKRSFYYIFIPFIILSAAAYVILEAKNFGYNYYVGGVLLGLLALYTAFQLQKSSQKRKKHRREILWHKYGLNGAVLLSPEEYDNLPPFKREDYMMGQTKNDMVCAHSLCGCYKDDIIFDDMEGPEARNLCGCLWRCFFCCCCERVAGRYVQCCGICAIAQEGRDLNKLVAPHKRAVDYVTMQPVLEYYSEILSLRYSRNWNFFVHLMAASKLSLQIIQSFVVGFVATVIFCLVFEFKMDRIGILAAVFAVCLLVLGVIHWVFNSRNLSVDAAIKSFASGFVIASTMAFVVEGIVAVISQAFIFGGLQLSEYLEALWDESYGYLTDDEYYNTTDYGRDNGTDDNIYFNQTTSNSLSYSNNSQSYGYDDYYNWAYGYDYYASFLLNLYTDITAEFGSKYPISYIVYLFFQCFFVAAFTEELAKYLASRVISDHPDFWNREDLEKIVGGTSNEKKPLVDLSLLPEIRSKKQERPLHKRCRGIMVSMISVSFGFACAENLLSIFLYSNEVMGWDVLLVRLFLIPIHPICAVWQAIGVNRRDIEFNIKYQLGKILFPAVFWHGLFDFTILLSSYLSNVGIWEQEEGYTYLVPYLVLLFALAGATIQFHGQQRRVQGKTEDWLAMNPDWTWSYVPDDGFFRPIEEPIAKSPLMKAYRTETGVTISDTRKGIETELATLSSSDRGSSGNNFPRERPDQIIARNFSYSPPEYSAPTACFCTPVDSYDISSVSGSSGVPSATSVATESLIDEDREELPSVPQNLKPVVEKPVEDLGEDACRALLLAEATRAVERLGASTVEVVPQVDASSTRLRSPADFKVDFSQHLASTTSSLRAAMGALAEARVTRQSNKESDEASGSPELIEPSKKSQSAPLSREIDEYYALETASTEDASNVHALGGTSLQAVPEPHPYASTLLSTPDSLHPIAEMARHVDAKEEFTVEDSIEPQPPEDVMHNAEEEKEELAVEDYSDFSTPQHDDTRQEVSSDKEQCSGVRQRPGVLPSDDIIASRSDESEKM